MTMIIAVDCVYKKIHPDMKVSINIKHAFYEALYLMNYQEAKTYFSDFYPAVWPCKTKEF